MSRRVLLGAGAAGAAGTLLGGCGERPPVPPGAGRLLARALEADRAALAAYRGLAGQAPAGARPLVARMRRRVAARARRLEAAGVRAGGSSAPPAAGPREARRREEAAAAAYVEALGAVRGERRELVAEGLAGAAEHAALLGAVFELGGAPAFPGMSA